MWGRGTTGWGLNWLPESAASGERGAEGRGTAASGAQERGGGHQGGLGWRRGRPGITRGVQLPAPLRQGQEPERSWGAARSPAKQTGRCRPGCGRGLGRPWSPRGMGAWGRSRSGSVIPLPPSPLLPHRGILGADSTAPPPGNGEGEGRREDRPTG